MAKENGNYVKRKAKIIFIFLTHSLETVLLEKLFRHFSLLLFYDVTKIGRIWVRLERIDTKKNMFVLCVYENTNINF